MADIKNDEFSVISFIDNKDNRLTQEYQNRLVNKIKVKFTDEQQQLFMSSFYLITILRQIL